jgi:hypothetical protein
MAAGAKGREEGGGGDAGGLFFEKSAEQSH